MEGCGHTPVGCSGLSGMDIHKVMPLPQALIGIRSARIQPTSNTEWKNLGRDRGYCDSRNSGDSHPYASTLLGAEGGGEEGEGKNGVKFREWRGGYRGVHLLAGP